jgi:deferrochelatase/peroxidase EfeB
MGSMVESFLVGKGRRKSLMTPLKEASKEDDTDEKKSPKYQHYKKHGHIRREYDEFKA